MSFLGVRAGTPTILHPFHRIILNECYLLYGFKCADGRSTKVGTQRKDFAINGVCSLSLTHKVVRVRVGNVLSIMI